MVNSVMKDRGFHSCLFICDGHLDIRRVLEKFAERFHELYGNQKDSFLEEEGRRYFLLYLRPIINGTGNYYVEVCETEYREPPVKAVFFF